MALTLITAPASDPVTLEEAKAHLRETSSEQDGLIAGYLLAARQHVETITRRALLTQTWDLTIDGWCDRITLPKPPLLSVTSVKYLDTAGVEQTLSASLYRVLKSDTGEWVITRAYAAVWPAVQSVESSVTIRLVCGYGASAGSIPEGLRQAILLLVGHWYATRETVNIGNIVNEVPMAFDALVFPYRVFY